VLEVDIVIVVPTFLNPFKSDSFFNTTQRLQMTKEMFDAFSDVLVSNFEINEGSPTPTAKS